MTRLFVTATGTGVGKTFVTAALAAAARRAGCSVRALKPLVSGFDPADWSKSDPAILLAAQGLPPAALDRVAPWRFVAPLSPDMAAARECRLIELGALVQFCRAALAGPEEVVLIEGVGGVMVPLDEGHTVLDWIRALDIPVLLVAGSYLGTISHTLTALHALAGSAVRAVVIDETPSSTVPLDETARTIERFAAGVPVLTLRAPPAADDLARLAGLIG